VASDIIRARTAVRAAPSKASGRFLLRLDPSLHENLQLAAKQAGLSLNEYCSQALAQPRGPGELQPGAELVQRALGIHGPDLVGVVVFGSWARGEAGPGSDVDVLIVLEPTHALTRSVYRAWDERTTTWGDHTVEPHVVQLAEHSVAGSVWAEVALDGLVLFERDLRVSRQLARIRRDIAAGKLVRRSVHGQPYWAEVA
jgi:hypothetical protein